MKEVELGFQRLKGGASLIGAYSVRAERKFDSPPITGGSLTLGSPVKVQLAAGTYWIRLVVIAVENLNGVYGYQVSCDGAVISEKDGDVNKTSSPRDSATLYDWAQITV